MFVIRHLIDTHVKQNRKHIFAAFIDFEKAFDSVWRDALLYKLLKAGIHVRMFNIIKSMYEETYYSVRCQDGLRAFFKSTAGLRQGCNLSPILFNLFINDMEKIFEDIEGFQIGSKSVKFLLYADDLVILCKSQSDLQLSVSRLHKYTLKWGLKINISKSKVIIFSKCRKRNYKIVIDGTILEQVDSFTYLGVDFHRTGNFKYASQSLCKKGLKASNSLLKVLLAKNLSPRILIKIFDQTVLPILTYGSEIWGTFSLQSKTIFDDLGNIIPEKQYLNTDIEQICLYFYKRLLMVNRNTSKLATLGELGRYPVQITVIIRMLKFWERITELEDNSLLKETLQEQVRTLYTNQHQWLYFVNHFMKISNVENCVNEGICGDSAGDLIKKLSRTLQERFISFWRKSIWSNKLACEPNHGNKLRTYRYFKKSFTNETYLNFELVRSDRNRHGGGVACYIRNDISFSVRGDFSSEIENIFLDILLPKTKPILIGILYRPPDQSKFLDNLSTSISQTCNFNEQEVYILGDLNINLINSQKHTPNGIKRYKEFCSLHGIEQLLTLPTRITNNSSSLLDHILTNSADRISQFGIVNVGLSDHQLIYCTRKITRTRLNTHKYDKMRSLKYYSEDLYVKKLKEIDFPDYSNFKDINEAYSDFTGKVASVIDEIAPIKEVRVKSNSQDWFDAEINEEIERRDKLLTKFKKSRSHSDNENYKKSRNKVQRMIKDKKKNFVIGKLNDNIGKPKELWKSLKSLGLPSKANSSATICLEKDGILSFDLKTNAEIFKDFYSNLANNLVKKLPTPPNKYGKTAVNNYYKKLNLKGKNFSFAPVVPATILKLLKQLNPAKSAEIDNLTGKFLKEGAPVLASPITDLVNLSISLSLFPDDCKIAKLKPLYKKEAKTKPKNYRPISLLPLLSKIIERIIHNQTQEFLDKNNILYKYQSGFRKHHSTDTCLSYLTDKVKIGFEEGLLTGMVLIDLQKAFDTIDHSILLEKMSCLGFAGKTIAWFTSYLTNRSFIVNVGKESSSPGELSCGVPQGSILGPLLFLLYINDMPQAVNSELLLYADDTCLIYMGKNIQKIEEQLNSDFTSLCEWFIDNKLSVHFSEEKTKSILFGTKRQLKDQRDLNLKYGDIEIKQYCRVTYLGCILDNILSGEHMAAKVLNTVNNRLKFLYRKQKFLSLSLRRLLCNALIQPHFDYACVAWYPLLNKRQSKRIQIAQNKCIRYCLNLDNKAHIGTNEFLKINWLPTKKRVEQCICANVFKCFNQMSPQYTAEIFHPSSSVHNTRRATQKLDIPFRKSCIGQKTLSYIGPKIWNNLPAQIKLSKSVNTFKHDIKKSFFDDLQKQNDDIFFYY